MQNREGRREHPSGPLPRAPFALPRQAMPCLGLPEPKPYLHQMALVNTLHSRIVWAARPDALAGPTRPLGPELWLPLASAILLGPRPCGPSPHELCLHPLRLWSAAMG